ncbi:unnamed protein product [Cladocopium goreaui]|uniref:Uncharacterized protein n=1 Tax=Cladocopium goreaui TaxID=2562237 RepID=A0A9P1CNJ0_9DINO|nr:unnamed protein product [Cladocopium goreaui]
MFWRSAQAQQAPSMMPPLSLESFLADPTPVPSPQGAVPFTTGNVEMWPPPNCEDVLPPVGGQLSVPRHDMAMPCWAMPAMPADMPPMGMPAMPAGMPPTGMPAMPAGMPPTGMPAMPAMPLSGGVEHFAVASWEP